MQWLIVYIPAVVLGALGGIANFYVKDTHRLSNGDYEEFLKDVIGGAIAALAFYFLGLPNHFNSLMSGYFGLDLIKKIAESGRVQKLINLVLE